MMNDIQTNLNQVNARIAQACQRSEREPAEIQLLLVSKTQPSEAIRTALAAGGQYFGENKAQELKAKAPELADTAARWHFIGHLQSNKIKDVIPWVEMIQSVDRWSLAEKLHKRLLTEDKKLDILLQVNTSFEDQKSGVAPKDALELLKRCAELESLHIKGLMTIGLFSDNETQVRDCFKRLKALQAQGQSLNLPGVSLETLSMGMSGDFEWAIEEGSTLVRIGTTIFGPRNY